MPYSQAMIADVVSLGRYETQVAILMDEEERIAMEFFIASATGRSSSDSRGWRLSQGALGPARTRQERRVSGHLFLRLATWKGLYGSNLREIATGKLVIR